MVRSRTDVGRARQPVPPDLAFEGQIPVVDGRSIVFATRFEGDNNHGRWEFYIARQRENRRKWVLNTRKRIAKRSGGIRQCQLRAKRGHLREACIEERALPRIPEDAGSATQ